MKINAKPNGEGRVPVTVSIKKDALDKFKPYMESEGFILGRFFEAKLYEYIRMREADNGQSKSVANEVAEEN